MSSRPHLVIGAGCWPGLQRPHLWLPHVTCASSLHGHLGTVSLFIAQSFKGKCLRTKGTLGSFSRPSLGGHAMSLLPHAVRPWESQATHHPSLGVTSMLRTLPTPGGILDSMLCSKESVHFLLPPPSRTPKGNQLLGCIPRPECLPGEQAIPSFLRLDVFSEPATHHALLSA